MSGEKWGGNVWIWSAPRPVFGAEKKTRAGGDGGFSISFVNDGADDFEVYWSRDGTITGGDGSDGLVFMMEVEASSSSALNTYEGHAFVTIPKGKKGGKRLHVADPEKRTIRMP